MGRGACPYHPPPPPPSRIAMMGPPGPVRGRGGGSDGGGGDDDKHPLGSPGLASPYRPRAEGLGDYRKALLRLPAATGKGEF